MFFPNGSDSVLKKILMKFLGKLFDEATKEFVWLMFKNDGKMLIDQRPGHC